MSIRIEVLPPVVAHDDGTSIDKLSSTKISYKDTYLVYTLYRNTTYKIYITTVCMDPG